MNPVSLQEAARLDAAASVSVRLYSGADAARWRAFVDTCPGATFFHRIEWRDLMENVFGHRTHFLLAERAGQIVGVLPLAEIRSRLFGHGLTSLPFCVYGGVATDDPEASALLHAAARDIGVRQGVSHVEFRNRAARMPDWPAQDLYVTFRKAIAPDVEANMLAIPRKQRAMVRKGIAAGLTSRLDDDVDLFFRLYADNVHRHGTPALPRRYFRALADRFGRDCNVLTVFSKEGEALSSVLTFYHRDEVLPYYAGDVAAARTTAANDFKYWELMRHGCEGGYRVFDYGRSKRGTGSFDFKKNWGFEPEPLHYEYALLTADRIPENNPLNPKYQLFIRLWRRLPRAVANGLGPYIVRNLG